MSDEPTNRPAGEVEKDDDGEIEEIEKVMREPGIADLWKGPPVSLAPIRR